MWLSKGLSRHKHSRSDARLPRKLSRIRAPTFGVTRHRCRSGWNYAKLSERALLRYGQRIDQRRRRYYEPENQLWADGAQKRRFMQLPAGTQIDTTEMDSWKFPVGTKVWKEFFLDGRKLETRLLEKRPDGTWFMMAFAWNEAETDALPVPEGQTDARDTPHDIPTTAQCNTCHRNASDFLLSIQAMQLAGQSIWSDAVFVNGVAQIDRVTDGLAALSR